MKLVALSVCLMITATAPAQSSESDTIQTRDVNGRSVGFILKDARGKTLTKHQSDSIYNKYDNRVFNLFKGGRPVIVELITPEDAEYASLNESTQSKDKQKFDGLQIRWLNKPFKNFAYRTISGLELNAQKLSGKIIVLNFWFTTCKPCIAEMPSLNDLEKTYKDVVFIALALDNAEVVKDFLHNRPFRYHQVADVKSGQEYGIFAYPTHIVIDQKGIVRFVTIGGENIKEQLAKVINNLKG